MPRDLPTPPPDAFATHRADVGDVELAFLREGVGGEPLLLLHGFPETKRIWWRCVEPLVAAGFEVIVPDLRGYGESDLGPPGTHDLVTFGADVRALVRALGHEACHVAAGDVGGVVAVDLALRHPGFVRRLCFFNGVAPLVADLDGAVQPGDGPHPERDYQWWQGARPDELAAQLATPEARERYVAEFYGPRLWASPGSFDAASRAFHTEPFRDLDRLRASWEVYGALFGTQQPAEVPRMFEPVPVPTLVLYGPDDHVVGRDFLARCEAAFPDRVGPLLVPDAGHFLPWERADVLCGLLPLILRG